MPPSALSNNPMECPMPQSNDLSRSLAAFDQDRTLIAVIEMSQSNWLVAGLVPGLERRPLKKLSPDEDALLKLVQRWRNAVTRPTTWALHRREEWTRRPGASPSMRIIASWSGSHGPPNTSTRARSVALAGELPSVSTLASHDLRPVTQRRTDGLCVPLPR